MQSFESIFIKKLVARVHSERDELVSALLMRLSHEDYIYKVGRIAALNNVLDTIEDVYKELTSPEKN